MSWKRLSEYPEPPVGALVTMKGWSRPQILARSVDPASFTDRGNVLWLDPPDLPALDDIEPPPRPTIPPCPEASTLRLYAHVFEDCDRHASARNLRSLADRLESEWWQPMETLPDGHEEAVLIAFDAGVLVRTHTSRRLDTERGRLAWRPLPTWPVES